MASIARRQILFSGAEMCAVSDFESQCLLRPQHAVQVHDSMWSGVIVPLGNSVSSYRILYPATSVQAATTIDTTGQPLK